MKSSDRFKALFGKIQA